ncbi:MAG: hypothetical protein RR623_08385 [Bacilli bacterium]
MPTRLERLNKYYVTVSDIRIIINIPYQKAKQLWNKANTEELNEHSFKAHETKVELKRVLKIANINLNFLRNQIESELKQKEKSN